jgi:hypothetical protein
VSGGQTGVDRAALDVARALGISHAGWCPRGRWAEDGPIADDYALRETPAADPAQRTAWNVRDSDATLVLARGALRGGTALAADRARSLHRPLRVVDLAAPTDPGETTRWLAERAIRVLNVAGPRESESPGIGDAAARFLREVLSPAGPTRSGSGVR